MVTLISIPPDLSPTSSELRAEVHRLIGQVVAIARAEHGQALGPLPGVRHPDWWTAPTSVRLAAILVLGEAYLIADPERVAVQILRDMAYDLSAAYDWATASRRPSRTALAARRAEPGPLAQKFDPELAARWVATGGTDDGVPAA